MPVYPSFMMLELSAVSRTFGTRTAVDKLTLSVERGEIFGLLGPNGAGKTTTINMAVGLLLPDSGEVRVDGGNPANADVRRRLGVAPQSLALYDELTGKENLDFFGRMQGLNGKALSERIGAVLGIVGLSDRARDSVKAYSGGMKRRLNLAVALIHDPPLLLFDEPTVGVDPQSRLALFENILYLKQLGKTVIYTTHYMEEAERLCDRVGIMDHGKLLALDTVDRLVEAHGGGSQIIANTPTGKVREVSDDPLARLTRIQNEQGLLDFRVEAPTLESVFLNLTGRDLRD